MNQRSTITLAIADDHALFRKGIIEILNLQNYFQVVVEAENGLDLLEKFSRMNDIPDLCLLDISMPKLNGYETLLKLKECYPEIKVLVITMHSHDYGIIQMLNSGAGGFLLKDCSVNQLYEAIISVHENGYYDSELTANFSKKYLLEKGATLSKNEQIFLAYCCTELQYQQIADEMVLSLRTIHGYRDALFTKLNIRTRAGLAMFAIQNGFVVLDQHHVGAIKKKT